MKDGQFMISGMKFAESCKGTTMLNIAYITTINLSR